MANVIELHVPAKPSGSTKTHPAAAARIALGNKERQEAAAAANAFVAAKRPELNRLNREISETKETCVARAAELKEVCGGRTHVPPVPLWVAYFIYAVGMLAEFAIAEGLLDYSFLQGRPADAMTFLEHFEGMGFFEGLFAAVSGYATQKELAAIGIAFYTVFAAKITGTWIRQREAKRSSIATWFVVSVNAVFFSACVGFVVLRHAWMAADPNSADLAYLAPVFLPIQLFFYSVASYVAAWLADPDPEASRLTTLGNRASKRFAKLVRQRARISAEVTSALVSAQAKCDQIANQALWDVSAYRHANLRHRDQGAPAPDFLLSPIGPEAFEPVAFDPVPDGPAQTLEDVLVKTGTGGITG